MAADFDIDDRDRETRWFFRLLMVGILGGGIAFFVFHRTQPMPPPQSLAGCYVNDEAPPLRLADDTLSVGQPDFTPVKFHLEWTKDIPIVIESDPEVQVTLGDNQKLRFVKDAKHFSNLYPAHLVAEKVWGVLKPEDRQFIAARIGSIVYIFKPAPASACVGI